MIRQNQVTAIKRVLNNTNFEMLDKQREYLNEAIIALSKEKPMTATFLTGIQNFLDSLTDAIKDN